MFGLKDSSGPKNETKHSLKNSSLNITVLAEECELKGSITCKGSVRIDGKVEGGLSIAGDLIIGPTANLQADIEARNVSIAGEVQGNIKVSELLELSSTARIHGDVTAKSLKIEEGARFNGRSTIIEGTGTSEDSRIKNTPEKTAKGTPRN
ncbi:protein of unknown function DUF583 [Syntrophobotulus glycolicus DSM 8271]|uniref:Integral membrane protein CcmA involved in cell shape determination n=1 Tax=Syntrophobotulus glycolicus (strain DSM 8271 / FlGlyR) TaxID=645991 RepID=F0T0W9_SYNGF|nr:polymer-forming cytoskeletal protein [Syntrophobotulus glycolicus]ADY56258.1 protein of unknown function DUF583 [Syntrophobotulus glycolicus DSM 8271]